MQKTGRALNDVRAFLAGRETSTLKDDPDFASRRNALQKLMLEVMSASKVRFNEPWGTLSLYRAAGSRRSSGKITAGAWAVQRDALLAVGSGTAH